MSIATVNPATNERVKEYQSLTNEELYQRLTDAQAAYETWKHESFSARAKIMKKCADLLEERANEYAAIMTQEMGKRKEEALAEVEKCAWVCRFYAQRAEGMLAIQYRYTDASKAYVRYDPIGPVLAVMPWNFPFWQVFRFAAPTVMAGNVGVLKHASNVPKCAKAIEQVLKDAGLPDGVFQSLLISSSEMEKVIGHDAIKAVTLTGSEKAGSSVAQLAGKYIKKSVMELGGSDPFIVLDDADLDQAAEFAVKSRFQNCGQSCIAAKRFILHKNIYKPFLELFHEKVKRFVIGDPSDDNTTIGPMAREDLAEILLEQVNKSVELGAEVVIGGGRPDMEGAYFEPTILTKVKPGMPAYEEETFGPVAAMIEVNDADEAIEVANDTSYGLGSNLWTKGLNRAEMFASRIDAGSVFINGMVKSDPNLPFGGVKLSGYGRELSNLGIREFMNEKTVWVG